MADWRPTDIPIPLGGLSVRRAFTDSRPQFSPDCLNVWNLHPTSGRDVLSTRWGQLKYNANRLSGANAVQDLVGVTKHDNRVSYSVKATPAVAWQKALPSARDGVACCTDRQGNVFVVAATAASGATINFIAKFNAAGTLLWTYPVPFLQDGHVLKSIGLDDDENVYVCVAGAGTTGTAMKYEQLDDDENGGGLRQLWSIDSPNDGLIVDFAVERGFFYLVENTATKSVLHRYDFADTTAPELVWSADVCLIASNEVAIAVDIGPDGAAVVAICHTADPPTNQGKLKKYGPQPPAAGSPATPLWTVTADGVGQAVIVDDNGYVYSQGVGTGGSPKHVSCYLDNGTSATLQWETGSVQTNFKGATSLAVDAQRNVYQAIYNVGSNSMLVTFNSAGVKQITYTGISAEGLGVCIDPNYADGGSKLEGLYLTTSPVATSNYAVHRLNLLDVTTSDGSPRETFVVGVCDGDVVRFAASGGVATPTNGTNALSTTARWVSSAFMFNRVLFTDGASYKSLDLLTDTVSAWAATSGGQIPPRARVVRAWNGAAVLARFEDNPHEYAISRLGDVDNWDFYPRVQTRVQAVLGSTSNAGPCPDIITCPFALADDLFVFGCDKSIFRLTGHPAAGGVFDLVTDEVGIAFDSVPCKDDRGAVYFFGSRGGVFRWTPGALPQRIDGEIASLMDAVDIGATRIRLAWLDAAEALLVILTPYAGGASTHYVWRRGNKSWWPWTFPDALNPTAVCIVDGDSPNDRVLLLGGADGYARYLAAAATSDDATNFDSRLVIGPVIGGRGREFELDFLDVVLSTGSQTVTLDLYGEESPEWSAGYTAVASFSASAGRNDRMSFGARGYAAFLRLRRSGSAPWGLESIGAQVRSAGEVTNR